MKHKLILSLILILASFGLSTVIAAPPENGLVGYWSMNDLTFTNSADVTWDTPVIHNTNKLTQTATGKIGQCVWFDNGGYVDAGIVPSKLSKEQQITINVWIKNGEASGEHDILSVIDRHGNELFVLGTEWANYLYIESLTYKAGGKSVNCITKGVWYNVTAIIDYNDYGAWNTKLYVNGTLVQDVENFGINYNSLKDCRLIIGAVNVTGGSPCYANLDELRIYNRALSEDELKVIYNESDYSENYPVYIAGGEYSDKYTLNVSVANIAADEGIDARVWTVTYRGKRLVGVKTQDITMPPIGGEIDLSFTNMRQGTDTKVFVTKRGTENTLLSNSLKINE